VHSLQCEFTPMSISALPPMRTDMSHMASILPFRTRKVSHQIEAWCALTVCAQFFEVRRGEEEVVHVLAVRSGTASSEEVVLIAGREGLLLRERLGPVWMSRSFRYEGRFPASCIYANRFLLDDDGSGSRS